MDELIQKLKDRVAQLEEGVSKLRNDLVATDGALQEARLWLSHLTAPTTDDKPDK